jgi:hypothetical protein
MFLKHEMNDNELLISTTVYFLLNLCFEQTKYTATIYRNSILL